ncbi:MAG: RNA polymerase sigma factor [Planctomycetota bacterium]|nr:RNA polymerase sigma factor [Planctomycetota bacterium]
MDTPTPDQRLLDGLRQGAPGALADAYEAHAEMVYNVCLRTLRQAQDAEDATQAVFLLLLRKARGLSPRTSLAGWLHRTAYCVCRESRRGALRRNQREKENAMLSTASPPTADPAWEAIRATLDGEVAALPDTLRAPIVAVYFEHLTPGEAAVALNIPETTLRYRLQQALERLRHRLDGTARLSALALGGLMTEHACKASPSAALRDRVLELAQPSPAGTDVPSPAQPYVRAYGRAQRWQHALSAAAVLLVAVLFTGGATLAYRGFPESGAQAAANDAAGASAKKAAEAGDRSSRTGMAASHAARGETGAGAAEADAPGRQVPGPRAMDAAAPPEIPAGPPRLAPDQRSEPNGGTVLLYSRNRYGHYPLATYAFHLGLRGDGRTVGNEVNLIFGNAKREQAFTGDLVDEGPRGLHGAAAMDGGPLDGKPRDEFRAFTRNEQNAIVDLGAVDYATVTEPPEGLGTAGYRVPVVEGHVYVLRIAERNKKNPGEPLIVKLKVVRHRDNDAVIFTWEPLVPTPVAPEQNF